MSARDSTVRGRSERDVRAARSAQGRGAPPGAVADGEAPVLAELHHLVGDDEAWLTVPEAAEVLGTDVSRVRRLLDDRVLVGVRRGRPRVLSVPRVLVEPEPMVSLPGTVTVLSDAGYTDAEALRWLFSDEPVLGTTPVAALRDRRIAPVRRQAQSLLI